MQLLDAAVTYMFLNKLVTPFEKWDAHKLGIIDKDGNVLKPRAELKTDAEKKAFGYFDVLAVNLKKLLAKVPGGKTVLGSYAAALLLLKEYPKIHREELDLDNLEPILETYLEEAAVLLEDVPTNAVGNDQVAGLTGDPPVSNKNKYKKANERDTKQMLSHVAALLRRSPNA
jgi:hypothetical protein